MNKIQGDYIMKLSDTVIASYENGFSGLYIKCPHDSINEIADA